MSSKKKKLIHKTTILIIIFVILMYIFTQNSTISEQSIEIKNLQNEVSNYSEKINTYNNTIKNDKNNIKQFTNRYNSLYEYNKLFNNKIIWDSNDITKTSNLSILDMKLALNNTNISNLSESFLNAEKDYQVNALFLRAIVLVESGDGKSDRAIYKNNLTGMETQINGNTVGITFNNWSDCINSTAKNLRENYINKGYKSVYSISQHYCPPNQKKWRKDILSTIDKMELTINNNKKEIKDSIKK